MLEIENLTKEHRAGVRANDEVSLRIEAGEVFGLLGPNGAGKTTLVRQVIGLTRPTSGSIRIGDVDVVRQPEAAAAVCSWQPQSQVPIRGLTPVQAVALVAELRGASRRAARHRAKELMAALAIEEWSEAFGFVLSGGVGRLVAFAMAAAVPGEVVILDEPTNDVDPLRRRLLWEQVRELAASGSAVLLVTHNVLEAERAVDHLALMDGGRVVAAGTPASLKPGSSAGFRLELLLEPGADFDELPGFVHQPVASGRRLLADVDDGHIEDAIAWARAERQRGRVEEFSVGPSTLEDVYVRLIDQEADRVITDSLRPAHPLQAYRILCRWRALQLRQELPSIVVAQVLFATGTAIGLGFLIPDVDAEAGAYLATGAFLINLLIVAIAVVPNTMTEAKVSGALDYLWALPFPRVAYLLAELTIWALAMLPGMIISLVVTSIRFDFHLHVSILVVPAIALTLVTAATVGAAIGLRSPSQQITNLFTNFVIIVVLLFSPVNFPVERLPGWLQAVHEVLPIAAMANLIRSTLVGAPQPDVVRDLVVLGVWCAVGITVTWRATRVVR